MREIKFRYLLRTEGACGRYKEWFEYCTIEQVERWPEEEGLEILARDEWTGVSDRNGQDIYENDVLSRNRGLNPFVVEYNHYNAAFEARGEPGTGWGAHHWPHCEVVGNIHDNRGLETK